MDLQSIEYLYQSGKMPKWAYYQQNNKGGFRNFEEQHAAFISQLEQDEQVNDLIYDKATAAFSDLIKSISLKDSINIKL